MELQRAGDLTDAAINLERAIRLNPNNVIAQTNLQVNEALAAGKPVRVNIDQLGEYENMLQMMTEGGPFDDPTFCFQYGKALAGENRYYRQAVAPLKRACELDPYFLPGRMWLARVYGLNHLPAQMVAVLRAPMDRPQDFSPDDYESQQLHMLLSAAYFQENNLADGSRLLEMEISHNPTNQDLLNYIEQIYEGRKMFSNALAVTERQLQLAPDEPNWLVRKGFLDNQLKQYNDAIITLKKALTIQKDNENAVFQLANAYHSNGNLEAARTNYESLQQTYTNSVRLAFALQDIAWQQHNTNEAIHYIEIYLAQAPTNTPEAQAVKARYQELKQPAGGK